MQAYNLHVDGTLYRLASGLLYITMNYKNN